MDTRKVRAREIIFPILTCFRLCILEFGNLDALQGPIDETVWGGEPAAEEMTKYLHPEIYTLYTTMPKIDIMRKAKLVPDQNGNVEVYKKFWKDDITDNNAPPLLVYADLVITDDPRN